MIKLSAGIAAFALTGCASLSFGPFTNEVVEGDPATYRAFEEAARACEFERIRRVSDGPGGDHFLIAYADLNSAPTRCLLAWLDREADGRLFRSGH